jgi:hypothetical protein
MCMSVTSSQKSVLLCRHFYILLTTSTVLVTTPPPPAQRRVGTRKRPKTNHNQRLWDNMCARKELIHCWPRLYASFFKTSQLSRSTDMAPYVAGFMKHQMRNTGANLLRIPHKPPAGSLKVLHAPARRGGIRRASLTKIYNLETDEFLSNPPFFKTNLAGVIARHFPGERIELI